MSRRSALLGSLLVVGCSQAYSGQRAPSAAPSIASSPYGVEIVGDSGRALPTYQQGDRFYVRGEAGQRYIVHVTNPTDRRVEAVVTVDGLDVIDGEDGDLHKRGYIVPPHGDLSIEGFRTSTSDVATFRFSSVDESYAGRKGKDRNVGVIAVALFDEAPQPAPVEIIQPSDPEPPPPPVRPYYGEDDRGGVIEGGAAHGAVMDGRADKAPAASGGYYRPAPPPDTTDTTTATNDEPTKTRRGGLGTQYGESRYSAATWTRFVRASETPIAIAELRYNDAAGLAALGIQVDTPVDGNEITKRETADPFPGDPSFSQAP